jgi:hypothetical protein
VFVGTSILIRISSQQLTVTMTLDLAETRYATTSRNASLLHDVVVASEII